MMEPNFLYYSTLYLDSVPRLNIQRNVAFARGVQPFCFPARELREHRRIEASLNASSPVSRIDFSTAIAKHLLETCEDVLNISSSKSTISRVS